jgi:tetratricopeptide (TPR) repeat protein
MTKHRASGRAKHSWFCYGVCLICAFWIKPAQDHFESCRGSPGQEPDLLFFSSPSLVKEMALGYTGLLADFYWMRTIQYYGRVDEAEKRPARYKNLSTLLDITTTLDPDLLDAYRAGSTFLSEADPIGAGQPKEAIRLLDKGIRTHPSEWRLSYDKGFVYYWYLRDYKAAGEVWFSASSLAQAPHWMASLAAMSLSKGGAVEIAIALWQRQYQESSRADVKENARNHLISFQVARDLSGLESLIEKFKARTGSYPKSLEELVRAQTHKYATVDPLGTPYEYHPRTGYVGLSPETKVRYLPIPESYKEQFRLANDD